MDVEMAATRHTSPQRIEVRPGLSPWVVSRYADIRAILADNRFGTDPSATSGDTRRAIMLGRPEEQIAMYGRNLSNSDSTDHDRLRRAVMCIFEPSSVNRVLQSIQGIVDQTLEVVRQDHAAEVFADYAVPVSVSVICHLLSVPEADWARFISWARVLLLDAENSPSHKVTEAEMLDYMVPFALNGPHGLGRSAENLSSNELISVAYQLFFAGHVSSAFFISNCVYRLVSDSRLREELISGIRSWDATLEEMLRLDNPVKMPTWRFAKCDCEMNGWKVQKGDPLLLLLATGNTDQAVFRDAAFFDPTRERRQNLTFGWGLHHCLGKRLARAELRGALREFVKEFPAVSVAAGTSGQQVAWRSNLMINGIEALPVLLRPQ